GFLLDNEAQYEKVDEHETIKILGHDLHVDGSSKRDLWPLTIKQIKKSLE
ncbi:25351_t:CDS:1, partial [Gigaspora rosea]